MSGSTSIIDSPSSLPTAATVIGLLVVDQIPTLHDLAEIALVIIGVAAHYERSDTTNPARR
jgi:threonine/homoserine efflux transporter RhtA